MRNFGLAILISVVLFISACATIIRGTTEAFLIDTEPSGATARTSLGFICEPTPCAIPKIKRNASFTVTIEKKGFKSATYSITNKRSDGGRMAMVGYFLAGGIVGGLLDSNNGATQKLVPNPLTVSLRPLDEKQ